MLIPVTLLIGLVIGVSSRPSPEELTTARQAEAEANEQLAAAQSDVERLEQELQDRDAQLAQAEEAARSIPPEVQAEIDGATVELDRRSDDLDSRQEELEQLETDLDARAEELDAREGQIASAEERVQQSQFGDGIWEVGVDIEPGQYRTTPAGSCYWARLSGASGSFDDIIANDNVEGQAIVTIASSDAFFESNRCGTWQKVG